MTSRRGGITRVDESAFEVGRNLAIHSEVSEVVIVEHQGREIDAFYRELGRNGIFERSGERDDRGGLDAIASEIVFAFGEGNRGGTWRACRRCWRRTRRGDRVAVALGRYRGCGYPVGIARPALTINLAQGSDRTGRQFRGVATARAEIDRDDTGTNADEAQHLLRLTALIIGAICRSAIGAPHDLGNLPG